MRSEIHFVSLFALLSLVMAMSLLFPAAAEDGEKEECEEIKVLDWPESIKKCIKEDEEKGLRDGTTKPGDLWETLVKRCPDVKKDDNGASLYDLANSPDAILVGSKKELVEKLTNYSKDHDNCCIKKIVFMGHGAPGKISVGDGQVTQASKYINGYPGNEEDWKKELEPLKKILCEDATFVLEGCSVGYCSVGLFKMQELAEYFNVTVVAPTVNMESGTHIDDLKENERVTVKPTMKQCTEDFYKKKAKEVGDNMKPVSKPFAQEIEALAFYPATYGEIPDITDEPLLPITDPGWIALFEEQIDSTRVYESAGECYESDSVIVVRYEGGDYDYAHTVYGHRIYERINDDGIDMMFMLSEQGREMVQEGILMTLEYAEGPPVISEDGAPSSKIVINWSSIYETYGRAPEEAPAAPAPGPEPVVPKVVAVEPEVKLVAPGEMAVAPELVPAV